MRHRQTQSQHPVIQVVKEFLARMMQNPDVYPIKYYKKNHRFKKRLPSVK